MTTCCSRGNARPALRIEISRGARARVDGRTWLARSWLRRRRSKGTLWTFASGRMRTGRSDSRLGTKRNINTEDTEGRLRARRETRNIYAAIYQTHRTGDAA